jgi:hypothetical protein
MPSRAVTVALRSQSPGTKILLLRIAVCTRPPVSRTWFSGFRNVADNFQGGVLRFMLCQGGSVNGVQLRALPQGMSESPQGMYEGPHGMSERPRGI